jgi:CheY-like chemotaxis protein
VRVVLTDDHDLVRSTIRKSIDRYPDIEVVGEAERGETGVEVVVRTLPDVVIVDCAMPGIDGAETTRRVLAAAPQVRVVAHSGDGSNETRLLDAGAAAFVAKGGPVEHLVSAIGRVAEMKGTGEPR